MRGAGGGDACRIRQRNGHVRLSLPPPPQGAVSVDTLVPESGSPAFPNPTLRGRPVGWEILSFWKQMILHFGQGP